MQINFAWNKNRSNAILVFEYTQIQIDEFLF